ncbi:MAG TPA: GyrI-like domain-containing protein [Vicinamibacterales bacterium]|jgi:AraC family transcriptional regulator
MDVAIVEQPALRVAALAHRGAYHAIGRTFRNLEAALAASTVDVAASTLIALYYDNPRTTAEADLHSAAGIILADGAPVPSGLETCHTTAGRYATLTCVGSYSELPAAWQHLVGTWLPSSRYRAAEAPSLEIYRNSPMVAPAEQLITELYLAIA